MASTILDIPALTPALKELYTPETISNLTNDNRPLLALLPKFTRMTGRYATVPVEAEGPQGAAAVFQNAQANAVAPTLATFDVKRAKYYQVVNIDNEAREASSDDAGAFIDAVRLQIDSGFNNMGNRISTQLFRSGTGSIGQIGTVAGGVITLTNADDISGLALGMKLNAAATDGGTPRAAGGWVVAVDRSVGTVTVSTTLGGAAALPALWAAGDFLVPDGDSNATISGLGAWLPWTPPTATPFFGVDRSVDSTRLAGVRYDGTGLNPDEAIMNASLRLAREGGMPDYCFVSYGFLSNLQNALSSKIRYEDLRVGEIGFQAIVVNGGNSKIKVLADPFCPTNFGYLLTMKTWKLGSIGAVPKILTYEDTHQLVRQANADALEARLGFYGNLWSNSPGRNAVIKFA